MRKRLCGLVGLLILAGAGPGCAAPGATRGADTTALRQRSIECLKRAIEYRQNPALRVAAVEAFESSSLEEGRAWVRSALLDEHPGVRFAGCIAVGSLRDATAEEKVRELVEDPDASVRVAALYAMHRLGHTEQSGYMPDYLLTHSDPLVRRNAALVLGRMEEPGAVKVLARAMKDPDVLVQDHALEAMARLGNADARQQLACMANAGIGSDEVFAINALAETRDRRHEDLYRGKLTDDESPHLEIRLAAARALALIGQDDGYPLAMRSLKFSKPKVIDAEDTAEGKVLRTKLLAAAALGAVGSQGALPALSDMMEESQDARCQVAAARAILDILGKTQEAAMAFPGK